MRALLWFRDRGWGGLAIIMLLIGSLLGDLVAAATFKHSALRLLIDCGVDIGVAWALWARVREALAAEGERREG